MAKEEVRPRSEVAGTTFGLLIFFVGVALLLFVFAKAIAMFSDPTFLTSAVTAAPGKGPDMASLGIAAAGRIIALFVMLLAGSLISSKGIHLYIASR